MQRGFIQIPILIAILIGFALLGGTGYVAYEAGQKSSRQNVSDDSQLATTTAGVQATTTPTNDKETEKTTQQAAQSSVSPAPIKQTEPVAPVQVQPSVSASAELQIEKCKAQRDASRGALWPVFLETVKLAEQKSYQSRLDALMKTVSPGTVPASYLAITAKISDAEHEKNLETAESAMETQLAKEYTQCLNGIQ